jgi:Escherichia/Staphylococcus phage prohead protease
MPQAIKREVRFITGAQIRAKSGEKPGVEGYAAVFNQRSVNLGWFREEIKPGAFARAIREKQDVRGLMNHDANLVLGRTKNGTLKLKEDDFGLRFEADLPDTQTARDLHELVKRGDIDGCSFGFVVTKQTWREERQQDGSMLTIREVEDLDLFDVGPVTFPAYTQTSVDSRSLWPEGLPEEVRAHAPAEVRDKKTKRVDGEDLTADCFAWVGDANDTSTWKLPIKFPSDEKTKSHIRNAIARFGQTKGIPEDKKAGVWKKIVSAAKKHGIKVKEEDSLRAIRWIERDGMAEDGECGCTCVECQDGDCESCSNENCKDEDCRDMDCMQQRSIVMTEEERERLLAVLRTAAAD